MLVFRSIKNSYMKEELRLVKETEKAWKDIENGKFRKTSTEDFLKNIKKW